MGPVGLWDASSPTLDQVLFGSRPTFVTVFFFNKKHLKNVGPIRHCEPPHAHSPDVASGTVARRLRIDVHDNNDNDDDNDNAWQRGPLWPHPPWNAPNKLNVQLQMVQLYSHLGPQGMLMQGKAGNGHSETVSATAVGANNDREWEEREEEMEGIGIQLSCENL